MRSTHVFVLVGVVSLCALLISTVFLIVSVVHMPRALEMAAARQPPRPLFLPVHCMSERPVNVHMRAPSTIDQVVLQPDATRVLLCGQTLARENGIWTIDHKHTWRRAPDYRRVRDVLTGKMVFVTCGQQYHDRLLVLKRVGRQHFPFAVAFEHIGSTSASEESEEEEAAAVALLEKGDGASDENGG